MSSISVEKMLVWIIKSLNIFGVGFYSNEFFNAEENNNWMSKVMGVPVVALDIKCPQFVLALVEMSLLRYSEAYEHFMYAYERGYYPQGERGYFEILKVYLELKSAGTEDEEIQEILSR